MRCDARVPRRVRPPPVPPTPTPPRPEQASNGGVPFLDVLRELHPDEWANLTQRINLVERHGRRDVDEHGDIVAATDDVQSATVSTKLRDTVSVGRARRLSTTVRRAAAQPLPDERGTPPPPRGSGHGGGALAR